MALVHYVALDSRVALITDPSSGPVLVSCKIRKLGFWLRDIHVCARLLASLPAELTPF
jgi:hypothetical protein